MLKRFARVFQRLQQTTGFLSTTFVCLTNHTSFAKALNRLIHVLPIKTLLHSCQQFAAPQVPTKSTTVQIVQNNLHCTACTVRKYRTKVITYQLTQKTISKLVITAATCRFTNQIFVPFATTLLLLIKKLLPEGFFLMNTNNTIQELNT
jgi:hypothetical protein